MRLTSSWLPIAMPTLPCPLRRLCLPDEAAPARAPAAGEHADHREDLGVRDLLAQPGEMAAGDVAGLVRDDADDLVRRLGIHEGADIDEDLLAVGDEGVEGAVVDEDDLRRRWR